MYTLDSSANQSFRCPRCGNRDFPDGIPSTSFICPVIGCGCTIDPNNMPLMLPDPDNDVPTPDPADVLVYGRDANGEVFIKGVYGHPETIVVPTMSNGRAVMAIGPRAFSNQKRLRRVTLPDTVSVIGEDAFADCTELESITFGSGLTLLDKGCLRGCGALISVALPDKVQENGRDAFANCTGLEQISLGSQVQIIRDNAFLMCASLSRVTYAKVPDHTAVTAFSGCYSLPVSVEDAFFSVTNQ